jgi:hypothetical protein
MLSSGLFPGFRSLNANISEHCSILIGKYLLAYEDGTECSVTVAFKLLTPENYNPKESIRHLKHRESLKSSNYLLYLYQNIMLLITNVSNVKKLIRRKVQLKDESLIMQKLYHGFNREANSVYKRAMTEIQ